MRFMIYMFAALTSISAFAAKHSSSTQDNVNYLVTVSDDSDWSHCSQAVCAVAKSDGNGECRKFPTLKILQVNLTTKGVDLLSQMSSCELVIEPEGNVGI